MRVGLKLQLDDLAFDGHGTMVRNLRLSYPSGCLVVSECAMTPSRAGGSSFRAPEFGGFMRHSTGFAEISQDVHLELPSDRFYRTFRPVPNKYHVKNETIEYP
jgi:hypothetical protein